MVRVPTPIPESLVGNVKNVFMGPVLEIVWRVFVLSLFLLAIFVLVAVGSFFGAALAGLLLTTLISDDVRAFVSDVWNRNFWVWRS